MGKKRNPYGAYVRPSTEKKRKKADAVKIKKAQALLSQAYSLLKNIQGHEELDQSKHMIPYIYDQMSVVTKWLDGTEKPELNPVETIDSQLEDSLDVQFEDIPRAIPYTHR